MAQPPDDPALNVFAIGALLLSMATGLVFLVKRKSGPLLAYRPRRPVPWGAAGAGLAVVMVMLALFSPLTEHAPADQPEIQEDVLDSQVALRLLEAIIPELLLVGGVLFLISYYFNATPRDVGWPENSGDFLNDVFIGGVVGFTALAPVHMVQGLLAFWLDLGEPSGHPLIKLVREGKPDVSVMVLAAITAIVVAPICEEIIFRLLLQGWLERWEFIPLQRPHKFTADTTAESESDPPSMSDNVQGGSLERAAVEEDEILSVDDPTIVEPPPGGMAGWPYGWLPITISSLLFGLAHFGYGPEPIPLFVLGLILGYVYHRTHRLVPCIVAHAVFNSFTMVVLWWMIFHGAR